jgi:hypothetical protein
MTPNRLSSNIKYIPLKFFPTNKTELSVGKGQPVREGKKKNRSLKLPFSDRRRGLGDEVKTRSDNCEHDD